MAAIANSKHKLVALVLMAISLAVIIQA
jgi:hypothetical protein